MCELKFMDLGLSVDGRSVALLCHSKWPSYQHEHVTDDVMSCVSQSCCQLSDS